MLLTNTASVVYYGVILLFTKYNLLYVECVYRRLFHLAGIQFVSF